jgi:NAD(P)-dependent dehydrogenase (short-subunit alcohol dehydrogenase family)
MMEWRSQVAVVTGGSRGFGRTTARLLAQRGAAVCVNYAVHADAAEAIVAEIRTARGRAIAAAADVTDSARGHEAMVAHTEAELGRSILAKEAFAVLSVCRFTTRKLPHGALLSRNNLRGHVSGHRIEQNIASIGAFFLGKARFP